MAAISPEAAYVAKRHDTHETRRSAGPCRFNGNLRADNQLLNLHLSLVETRQIPCRCGVMKFVKILLGIIIVLVVTFLLGGMLLPSGQYVERSAVVKADQAEVFALVSDYLQFNKWSPWATYDPDAEYEFSGPATGVGSKMNWRSEQQKVGNGTQEIVEFQPDTMVKSKLTFEGFDTPSYATFTLRSTDSGTHVTWSFDANMDTMLGRYMGLMMDKWVGADYELGLARLQELAEKGD